MAWVALEAHAEHLAKQRSRDGEVLYKLHHRLAFLLGEKGIEFDVAEYRSLRDFRNELIHPSRYPIHKAPGLGEAEAHFSYCLRICEAISGSKVRF